MAIPRAYKGQQIGQGHAIIALSGGWLVLLKYFVLRDYRASIKVGDDVMAFYFVLEKGYNFVIKYDRYFSN